MQARYCLIAVTIYAVCGCLFSLPAVSCDQTVTSNITDGNVQAKLKVEKNNAENLALAVIGQYDATTDQYGKAKELYTNAQIQFNAFTSTMLDNFAAGRKVNLDATAAAAASSSKVFCDYVESLKIENRGFASLLAAAPVLVDIGEKLWGFFADRAMADRTAFAQMLRPQITWVKWSRLTN